MCHGTGEPLGALGKLMWYRCRQCGWTFPEKELDFSSEKSYLVPSNKEMNDGTI
jgi:tRNA(Ile2) C34 agmatinyltransferase TiaS